MQVPFEIWRRKQIQYRSWFQRQLGIQARAGCDKAFSSKRKIINIPQEHVLCNLSSSTVFSLSTFKATNPYDYMKKNIDNQKSVYIHV